MAGVNKVILLGNLGKDPEVKTLESGVSVATFSIATSESYKDKAGEKVEKTEWHNIVAWKGLADVAGKYLKKGDKVFIEGKMQTRSYEKDGAKRYVTEVVALNLQMLGQKKQESGQEDAGAPAPPEDDLPF